MRIAIAVEWCDPNGGGAERSTHEIAEILARRRHEVTVLAGGAPASLPATSYTVERWRSIRKPRTGADAKRFSRWAAHQIFGDAFDAGLSVTPIVPATLVEPRAGLMRPAMIRGVAAWDGGAARTLRRVGHTLSPRKRSLLRLEKAVLADRRVHRFVAISKFMARQFTKHYQVPDERMAIIPNATSAAMVDPAERESMRRMRRNELRLADNQRAYVFPALDAQRKGLGPLLRAFARVREIDPSSVLLVAGPWPRRLRRLADDLGVAGSVCHLGRVPDMRSTYCAADATVIATFYDPASKVVIESLKAGTPAITTRFDGSAEWIEACGSASAGRIIDDPRDTVALADAMLAFPAKGDVGDPFARVRGLMDMATHVEGLESLLLEATNPDGVASAAPSTAPMRSSERVKSA